MVKNSVTYFMDGPYSLIYPYLSYCNMVWASTYKSRLHGLTILQKRAVRFLAGGPYGSHTKELFSEFGLLRVEQIRIAQIGDAMIMTCYHWYSKASFVILAASILTTREVRIPIVVTMLTLILDYSPSNLLVPW